MLLPGSQDPTLTKPTKTKNEFAGLVARAVADAIGAWGAVPPSSRVTFPMRWAGTLDVSLPAPTPTHRKAIDGIRDLYDLG
jgi:hypothetical protein